MPFIFIQSFCCVSKNKSIIQKSIDSTIHHHLYLISLSGRFFTDFEAISLTDFKSEQLLDFIHTNRQKNE